MDVSFPDCGESISPYAASSAASLAAGARLEDDLGNAKVHSGQPGIA